VLPMDAKLRVSTSQFDTSTSTVDSTVHVVAELEQLGVDYIVRARPSSGMKDRLSAGAETVTDEYTMQRKRKPTASIDVTVFAVPHRTIEDEYVWFVTSLDIDPATAKAYAAAFRRRWGIETSYR
ncbi:transposase, partial [Halobellus rufus]